MLTMYKDPADVPEEVYLRLGKVKPKKAFPKEKKLKVVFRQEELETMATPLSLRLEAWLNTGNTREVPDVIRDMDPDLIASCDPYAIAITSLLTYIARNMGEQEVERALYLTAQCIMDRIIIELKERFEGDKLAQPLTAHPVPDLVVILGENDEPVAGNIPGRIPVLPPPEKRILPGVHVSLTECLGQVLHPAEVYIGTGPISGQQGAKAVMEVIVPLGIQPVSAQFRRTDHPGIVEGALGHEKDPPAQGIRLLPHSPRKLLQEWRCGKI